MNHWNGSWTSERARDTARSPRVPSGIPRWSHHQAIIHSGEIERVRSSIPFSFVAEAPRGTLECGIHGTFPAITVAEKPFVGGTTIKSFECHSSPFHAVGESQRITFAGILRFVESSILKIQ